LRRGGGEGGSSSNICTKKGRRKKKEKSSRFPSVDQEKRVKQCIREGKEKGGKKRLFSFL